MSEEIEVGNPDADFLAGFQSVRGDEAGEVSPKIVIPPKEEKQEEAEETPAEVVADQQEAPVEQQEAQEELRIAGFSEAEIKNLFARVARLDELESQVRKANGKIGELNGKLKEFETKAPQPTQSAPAVALDDPSLNQWASDYPELVAIAEAKANQRVQEALGAIQVPDVASIKQEIYRETQLELMDTLHEGWRDTVNSQDFNLWLSAQPDSTRQTFETSDKAKDLSAILKGFDGWKSANETRSSRKEQSNQRLRAGLTPDGIQGRVTQAPSAEDEFIAGFRSVRPG